MPCSPHYIIPNMNKNSKGHSLKIRPQKHLLLCSFQTDMKQIIICLITSRKYSRAFFLQDVTFQRLVNISFKRGHRITMGTNNTSLQPCHNTSVCLMNCLRETLLKYIHPFVRLTDFIEYLLCAGHYLKH